MSGTTTTCCSTVRGRQRRSYIHQISVLGWSPVALIKIYMLKKLIDVLRYAPNQRGGQQAVVLHLLGFLIDGNHLKHIHFVVHNTSRRRDKQSSEEVPLINRRKAGNPSTTYCSTTRRIERRLLIVWWLYSSIAREARARKIVPNVVVTRLGGAAHFLEQSRTSFPQQKEGGCQTNKRCIVDRIYIHSPCGEFIDFFFLPGDRSGPMPACPLFVCSVDLQRQILLN